MEPKNIKDNSESHKGKELDFSKDFQHIPKSIHAKKAEKICAALFLISNFMSEVEPLKWDVRKGASRLAALLGKLHQTDVSYKKHLLNEAAGIVAELSSLVEVASLAGLLSSMNGDVLSKELAILFSSLSKEMSGNHKYSNVRIPQNFFSIPEPFGLLGNEDNDAEMSRDSRFFHQNTIKDKNIEGPVEEYSGYRETKEKPVKKIREYGTVAIKRNRRQNFIIGILKKKKDLTIKDISTIFHDCSEKTIQRELAVLVREGVVVREG